MKFISKILSLIKSSLNDLSGSVSHTKLSSYFILGSILIFNLVALIIDIFNGVIQWKKGLSYVIPMDHILIYSLTLTHHLVLLGLKKGSEVNYLNAKVELDKMVKSTEITPEEKTESDTTSENK